jgi:hypothetical protein
MVRTNYCKFFNQYVYSDLRPITSDQGHDTSLGPGQQSCEILFKSTRGSGVMAWTNLARRRTDNAIK